MTELVDSPWFVPLLTIAGLLLAVLLWRLILRRRTPLEKALADLVVDRVDLDPERSAEQLVRAALIVERVQYQSDPVISTEGVAISQMGSIVRTPERADPGQSDPGLQMTTVLT